MTAPHAAARSGAQTRSLPISLLAAILGLSTLALYWGVLWQHRGEPFPQSRWPYFVYYADALLDGSLSFTTPPPARLDLAEYQGRLYMHQPPFPAVLLAPAVALFGLDTADRFAAVLLGALNGVGLLGLLSAIDRRGLLSLPLRERLLLCGFLVFGSVHFCLAVTGNPWEQAHLVCNALVILALWAAVEGHFGVSALAYVGILFTRSHVFLTAPLAAGLAAWATLRHDPDPGPCRAGLLRFGALALAGLLALFAFNAARFGSPFETGITHHAMHPLFAERFEEYGYFHWVYLPRNLYALLLAPPRLSLDPPRMSFSPAGLSILLASPLYLFLFRSLRAPTRRLGLALWAGVGVAMLPVLLVMGTGELQFGHRYSSDLSVFLILLVALGLGGRFGPFAWVLLAASVAMNAAGALWFVTRYSQ